MAMPVRIAEGSKPFVSSKNCGFGVEILKKAHVRQAGGAFIRHCRRWSLRKKGLPTTWKGYSDSGRHTGSRKAQSRSYCQRTTVLARESWKSACPTSRKGVYWPLPALVASEKGACQQLGRAIRTADGTVRPRKRGVCKRRDGGGVGCFTGPGSTKKLSSVRSLEVASSRPSDSAHRRPRDRPRRRNGTHKSMADSRRSSGWEQ